MKARASAELSWIITWNNRHQRSPGERPHIRACRWSLNVCNTNLCKRRKRCTHCLQFEGRLITLQYRMHSTLSTGVSRVLLNSYKRRATNAGRSEGGQLRVKMHFFFKFETKLLHLRHRIWKEFGELRERERKDHWNSREDEKWWTQSLEHKRKTRTDKWSIKNVCEDLGLKTLWQETKFDD